MCPQTFMEHLLHAVWGQDRLRSDPGAGTDPKEMKAGACPVGRVVVVAWEEIKHAWAGGEKRPD